MERYPLECVAALGQAHDVEPAAVAAHGPSAPCERPQAPASQAAAVRRQGGCCRQGAPGRALVQPQLRVLLVVLLAVVCGADDLAAWGRARCRVTRRGRLAGWLQRREAAWLGGSRPTCPNGWKDCGVSGIAVSWIVRAPASACAAAAAMGLAARGLAMGWCARCETRPLQQRPRAAAGIRPQVSSASWCSAAGRGGTGQRCWRACRGSSGSGKRQDESWWRCL
jgi:hypothetical protein